MRPKTIACLPPAGFLNVKASVVAYGWASWEAELLRRAGDPVEIQRDGRRGFECRIAGIRVDSWFKTRSGQQFCLMFQGCFW